MLLQHLKAIIIHVHVPLHCTAWINRESWSLVETQAGSFTFLTFNFELWRLFPCSTCKKCQHRKTILGRRRKIKLVAPLYFLIFLPQVLLFVLDTFLGCSAKLNWIQKEAEFSELGRSPPSLSLSDCRPPSGSRQRESFVIELAFLPPIGQDNCPRTKLRTLGPSLPLASRTVCG